MRIALGSDKDGFELKEYIGEYLKSKEYDVIDLSIKPAEDFVDSSVAVTKAVLNNDADRGIMFDRFGTSSAISSNKIQGMVTANVTEENTAHMTTEHNGAKAIAIGSGIVAKDLAKAIVDSYLSVDYAGGRHQIRLDMLEKLI